MTPRDEGLGMWAAILIGLTFFAWAAAPWLDSLGAEVGETVDVSAAERHFEMYKHIRCE